MNALRIWIDTDPALGYVEDGRPKDVDDAFAIVEALGDEQIEVAGISSVFGNSPSDVGFRIARDLVAAMGADVGVARGAAAAPPAGTDPTPGEAAAAMAAALRTGPLSIVAIGPLTNVAALLCHHPEEARAIERVVIVAGRSPGQVFELHGATGIPDFNFECDPGAARVLMESDVPVTLTGFELTSRVVLTHAHLESLRGRSAVADRIVEGALPWLAWWTQTFPTDGGFHPWDSAALAVLTHPEWFVREPRGWRIRSAPEGAPGTPGTPWLELGADLGSARDLPERSGQRATYCPDFAPGGAAAFVEGILAGVP